MAQNQESWWRDIELLFTEGKIKSLSEPKLWERSCSCGANK